MGIIIEAAYHKTRGLRWREINETKCLMRHTLRRMKREVGKGAEPESRAGG